jgi:hypothetical protein
VIGRFRKGRAWGEQVVSFMKKLDRVTEQLPLIEREKITDTIAFLQLSITTDMLEKDPDEFDTLSVNDLMAISYSKLYVYAQKNGRNMTPRKYIELADELKSQNSELWERYKELNKRPNPRD